MADQMLRFCHDHIRKHNAKVPNHGGDTYHTPGEKNGDTAHADGDVDDDDVSTDRVVYVTFENICEFFERVARGEATPDGETRDVTQSPNSNSTPPAAESAEKLAEASDMVEYMHTVVEMCEATNYDDPGLELWKADDALGEQDGSVPGREPAEAEAYSAEDVEEAAAKM